MRCAVVALSAVLMGTLPLFVRALPADPLTISFVRFALGALFLLPISKLVLDVDTATVGFLNFLTVVCYITAIKLIKVAISALLLYMAPVYVTVYAWLRYGEVERKAILALPLAIVGLCLMLTPYGKLKPGIVVGILSGVFYAMLFVKTKSVRERVSSLDLTFTSLVISSVLLLPQIGHVTIVLQHPLWTVGLGLIPTALAFTLFNYGIEYCRVEQAPILALVEPVSAGIFGYVFLGESLTPLQTLGAILVLVGVALNWKA